MTPSLSWIFQKLYYKDYTSTTWKPEPYKPPKFEEEPPPEPLPKYYPPYLKAPHNPVIPYREVTTKKEPVEPYKHVFPTYTTTTTTTTTTYVEYSIQLSYYIIYLEQPIPQQLPQLQQLPRKE